MTHAGAPLHVRKIWIPCEAFDVSLSANDDGPTPFEKALMLFLAARGRTNLPDINDFLRLGERLSMDLITGLWRLGYLVIDTVHGSISLEPSLYNTVKSKEPWKGVATAHRLSQTLSFMRDLVSGQIVEDRSSSITPRSRECAPILIETPLLEAVTRGDLVLTALHHSELSASMRSRRRTLDAHLARDDTGVRVQNLCWVRFSFETVVDPDIPGTVSLRHVPMDDPALDRISPGIARALSAWSVTHAEHTFVRQLLKGASKSPIQPRAGLGRRAEELEVELAAALDDPQSYATEIPRWESRIRLLEAEVATLAEASASTRLHVGRARSEALFDSCIRAFGSRLIVLSPEINSEGLARVSSLVAEQMRRNSLDAMAFFLWGTANQSGFPKLCHNYLENLAAEVEAPTGSRLAFAARSSRLGGSLAVADGTKTAYFSHSPLELRDGPEPFVFALEVESSNNASVARRAIEIARERAPDFAMAERMVVAIPLPDMGDDGLGSDADLALRYEAAGAEPTLIEITAGLFDLHRCCQSLRDRLGQTRSAMELISDDAIFQSVLDIVCDEDPSSCEPTLVLGFGATGAGGRPVPINRALVRGVAARAKHGLPTIALIERRDSPGNVDITALETIAADYPGVVTIEVTPRLCGGFACGETRFLCAANSIVPTEAAPSRLANRLIGMAALDEALCRTFRDALALRWPGTPGLACATYDTANGAERGQTRKLPILHTAGVLAKWTAALPADRRQALRAALANFDPEPRSALLRALLDLSDRRDGAEGWDSLRTDVLNVAAAAEAADVRDRAITELAVNAWYRQRWPEAALLLTGVSRGACPISAELAIAAMEADSGLPITCPTAIETTGTEGWLCAIAISAKAVLANGDDNMAQLLAVKLVAEEAPGEGAPLHAIAKAAVEFWQSTGSGVDPAILQEAVRARRLRIDLPLAASAFKDAYRLHMRPTAQNAMLKRVVSGLYVSATGLRQILDLMPDDVAQAPSATWGRVLVNLEAVLGSGTADLDALAKKMFERADREHRRPNEDEITGTLFGVIKRDLRFVLERALRLRDAIVSRYSLDRGDPSAARLIEQLEPALPKLRSLVSSLEATSMARPVLEDLADELGVFMGEGP